MCGAGISPSDTVILYGDNYNWFSAYGFWLFKIYGHKDVRLMNGGRIKWLDEPDKEMTTEVPHLKPVPYKVTAVASADLQVRYRFKSPDRLPFPISSFIWRLCDPVKKWYEERSICTFAQPDGGDL